MLTLLEDNDSSLKNCFFVQPILSDWCMSSMSDSLESTWIVNLINWKNFLKYGDLQEISKFEFMSILQLVHPFSWVWVTCFMRMIFSILCQNKIKSGISTPLALFFSDTFFPICSIFAEFWLICSQIMNLVSL